MAAGPGDGGHEVRKTILLLGVVALMLSGIPAIAQDDDMVEVTDITIIEDHVGDRPLKFTGEIRARTEYTDNRSDFNSDNPPPPVPGNPPVAANDDSFSYSPYRVRLGLIGALPKDVYAMIQLQVADTWGLDQEQRSVLQSNSDPFDLYQAFIKMNDIDGTKSDLYIGRQELVIGTEFLLGNLDFYNGVSHDGLRYRWGDEDWLDVFWFKQNETFANDSDSDLFGANYTWNSVIEDGDIGVYLLWLRDKNPAFLNLPQQNPLPGINLTRLDLGTIGGRVGKLYDDDGGFIYNAELAIQFGNVGQAVNPIRNPPLGNNQSTTAREDASVFAYGFEGMFGYDFGGDNSVWIRAYYTSGDDDAADDEIGEFNPLFQDFHTRNGIADVVSPTNLTSVSIGYKYDGERNDFGAEIFYFMATEATVNTRDGNGNTNIRTPPTTGTTVGGAFPGLYNGTLVAPNSQDETNIGSELDLWYDFTYSQNLAFNFGLGLFFPGDAVKLATSNPNANPPVPGSDDMVTRLYGQARLTW